MANERYIVTYCSVTESVNLSGPFIDGLFDTRQEAEKMMKEQIKKVAEECKQLDPNHVWTEICEDGTGSVNFDNSSIYQWAVHSISEPKADSSDIQLDKEKNTRVHYCYTDAANYKCQNYAVVKGTFTKEQIDTIIGCLEDGEYFIPYQVGLDEERFADWTEDDHPWFTLYPEDFTETDNHPDAHYYEADTGNFRVMTAHDLYQRFLTMKGKWDAEEAERVGRDNAENDE